MKIISGKCIIVKSIYKISLQQLWFNLDIYATNLQTI